MDNPQRHSQLPAYYDREEAGDISSAARGRIFANFPVQNTPWGGFLALRGILSASAGGPVTQPSSQTPPESAGGEVDFSSFLEQ